MTRPLQLEYGFEGTVFPGMIPIEIDSDAAENGNENSKRSIGAQ
jgi:hypothetical protein